MHDNYFWKLDYVASSALLPFLLPTRIALITIILTALLEDLGGKHQVQFPGVDVWLLKEQRD